MTSGRASLVASNFVQVPAFFFPGATLVAWLVITRTPQAWRQSGWERNMRSRSILFMLCITLGACASNPLPPPNSIRATFDRRAQMIQVYVSNAQMPRQAWLVNADGNYYSLPLTLVSGPHVNYTAPPSIGLGSADLAGMWAAVRASVCHWEARGQRASTISLLHRHG